MKTGDDENTIDLTSDRMKKLGEYLDDIFPGDAQAAHPFLKFVISEIVIHPNWGLGIVTGFRIPDLEREMEGLGVQFVRNGTMERHRVFTPSESLVLQSTGVVYIIRDHGHLTLEDVLAGARNGNEWL